MNLAERPKRFLRFTISGFNLRLLPPAWSLAIERTCMEPDWPTRLRRRLMRAGRSAPAPAGGAK